nr:MAG TPA: hypothetical protein [Caudoviricetes sp.]
MTVLVYQAVTVAVRLLASAYVMISTELLLPMHNTCSR